MKQIFTTKRICRAGLIAALYVALTCAFGQISYIGIFQFRPAEALCLTALFYVEAIPALYIGCMLANVFSLYGAPDIFLGSLVTLVAALLTYLIGRLIREEGARLPAHIGRVALGGLFPVVLNAAIIPIVIVYIGGFIEGFATAQAAYWWNCISLLVSQSVWIWGLGTPLYAFITRMRKSGKAVFLDARKPAATAAGKE